MKPVARRLALPLAALTLAVLLAHGLALEGISRWTAGAPAAQRLPEPVFTRVLQPAAPPPAVAPPAPPRRPAYRKPRPPAAAPAEAAAPAPEPAPSPVAAEEPAPAPAEAAPPQQAQAPTPPASAPAAEVADTWPPDTRVNYRLGGEFRGGPLHGKAAVQWQRQGPQYQAQVEFHLGFFISRSMTSQGEVTPAGLVPRSYEEAGGNRRRGVRLTDEAVQLHDGRTLPRPEGVQDTASQFVELGHRFRTGLEQPVIGRSLDIWLARPGGVDRWTYDIAAEELLKTPKLGEVRAIRLTPRPIANPRGNVTAEIWFAPSLQWLPVRVRVRFGDEAVVDLLVDSIEQR